MKFARLHDGRVIETIEAPPANQEGTIVPGVAVQHRIPPDPNDPEGNIFLVSTWALGPEVIEPLFPAEAGWLECPMETGIGWLHDGAAFGPPPEPTLDMASILIGLKAEAGLVIGAVVSTTAQLNLNAAMNVIGAKPTSARSAEERAFTETFAEGHAWIQAVRARIPALLATAGGTPAGEERWPQPSQAVRSLAALY